MREYSNEMKGTGREIKGKIKEETGDLLGNRRMEVEGKVEKNVGKVQREVGRVTRDIKDSVDRDRVSDSGDLEDIRDADVDEDEELEEIGPTRGRR